MGGQENLQIIKDENNKLPIWIKGTPETNASGIKTIDVITNEYLEAIKDLIQIKEPAQEFVQIRTRIDDKGQQHIRMQQQYNGIKVYGGEIILHESDGIIGLFNGRYYPTPSLESDEPVLSETAAKELVKNIISQQTAFKILTDLEQLLLPQDQLIAELLIYHQGENPSTPHLAWHVTARPNIVSRWEYFVDAIDGNVLHFYNNICQIHGGRCEAHPYGKDPQEINTLGQPTIKTTKQYNPLAPPPGPTTANAIDLKGINRTIHVYEEAGTYFMIDASRDMYNASQSNIPDEPVGVVWTIDGNNNSPENSNFVASHVTSSNNSWNNATAVSAHYNGGEAYEYFEQTFNRNSINGQGGTIVSLINITESNGTDMDNAFWNGQAMFYGNGNQIFEAPLAKASDVAGHEMAHGVIQSTANLQYQNESGALNESFADIFGAMIDRDDWQIGEEIADNSVFPSGTMRDMQNPHNGGTSSNFYWQPDHYDERYTGSEDNGGVHINSGIPNHAFYLFASNSIVGKDKAEQVYYDALEDYLVASSKFVDLRNAIVEVAQNSYGTTVSDAAADAFNQVGIGDGPGTNNQNDAGVNPGEDFILWSDIDLSNVKNALPDGTDDGTLSTVNHISKPSVSDDGFYINFVGEDHNIWELDVDWSEGTILDEFILSSQGDWRNVATSKDGSKIAAVTTNYDNNVFVYDFGLGQWETFELYNPTYTQGVTTGDVDFADVLEFDLSGEYLMYDAQSTINGDFGTDISYWDIGFIRVWNNQTGNFGDGDIQKLFSGLPDNVSVGNPTFSKNSPYIIAFDYIEDTPSGTEYAVLGINLETNNQGLVWENNTLGYPSYSIDDNQMVFSAISSGLSVIGLRELAADKVNGTGDAFELIQNATWAVWFATGERDLMIPTHEVGNIGGELQVMPNPFSNDLHLNFTSF